MYLRILSVFAILLAFTFSSSAADKAQEIMENSLKAAGGKDKFKSIKTWNIVIDLKVVAQNNMDVKISFWNKIPNKMRALSEVAAMGMKKDAGTDGITYWATTPGDTTNAKKPVPDMFKEQVKMQLNMYKDIIEATSTDFNEKGYKLKYIGLKDIDDKKCNLINAIAPDSSSTDIYFDAISNLLYCSIQTITQGTQTIKAETKIKEYQKVKGLTLPKKIEVAQNGTLQVKATISSVKIDEAIDDSMFKAN